MSVKSLAASIIDAINDQDVEQLDNLFSENPEQLDVQTFMGGQTWIGYASQKGKLRTIEKLFGMGADINIGDSHYGSKPICSAADNGHFEIAKYLIDHGSDLDVDASVRNPLFAAVVGRSPEIVRLLLDAGIDATVRYNSPTMTNMDAVAFALMRGENECARLIAHWNAKGDNAAAQQALAEADAIADKNASGR